MRVVALTTLDNPYDPIEDFEEWFKFDTFHGFQTPSLLDRVAHYSDDLSQADQDEAIEFAIDSIVEDLPETYTKIVRDI